MDNSLAIKCMNGECEDINQIILARAVAVKALEKQIPAKLIVSNLCACPDCHTIILGMPGNYCGNCGQALERSEI